MSEFNLLKSEALVYLWGAAIIALIIWGGLVTRQKRERLFKITQSHIHQILSGIGITILALLILSLTRPYSGFEEIEIKSEGADTMLVVDISTSMLTKDLSPSRLEFAKRKILDLTQHLAQKRPGDRVGITLFAGESYQFCPLTSDYGAVRQFAKSISPDLISMPGSNLTSAIIASIGSFKSAAAISPGIILFSDGEDSRLDLEQAISAANQAKITISVLGLGTTEGMPIEQSSGEFIKDNKGQIVVSKLIEQPLLELAQRSNGLYQRGVIGDADLVTLLPPRAGMLKEAAGSERIDKIRIYTEVGPMIIWAAVFLLLIYIGLAKSAGALVIAISLLANASQAAPSQFDGYRHYERGEYEQALQIFQAREKENPEDLKNLQALASSLYKLGKFEEAAQKFKELESRSLEGKRQFEASYNLANSLFQDKRYKDAIDSYDKALKIKPGDEPAIFNRKLAEQLLIEQQKQEQQEKQENKNNEEKNQEKQKSEPQQSEENSEKSDQNQDSDQQQEESSDKSEGDSEGEQDKQNKDNKEGSEQSKDQNKEPGQDEQEQESPTQANQDEQKPDSEDSEQPVDQAEQELKEESISKREAEAWIQSLPESPALLHTKRRYGKPMYEQTW